MDEQKLRYRNELKYVVTAPQITLLKSHVTPFLRPDPHVGPSGSYRVRSLYFDDIYGTGFLDNENGVAPREKFRIRIYNGSDAKIALECKRKERGKTHKASCPLTREQAELLMGGSLLPITSDQPPLLRKLLLQMQMRRLRPAVIVEYDRVPYVCRSGNVRVTFDTDISASSDLDRFFAPELLRRPVMPVGQHLMEVKYDEYLPDPVYEALNLSGLRQETYSKYYYCRKFAIRKQEASHEHF